MKACIFDLDGTLTDTLDSLVYSVNLTLQEMGLTEISRDQCRRFVGNGARKLIEEALNAAGDKGATRIEEGMQVYGRVFGENCTYHVAPYAGILEALEELKDRGIRLAVLSNKPHQQTIDVVETFFGKELFDYVQGQMDGIPRKPDPAGIHYILKNMQIPESECLYVGDSEVDIVTGRAAGVKSVGVEWGFRDRKTLEAAGAEHIITTPDQLLQFVS